MRSRKLLLILAIGLILLAACAAPTAPPVETPTTTPTPTPKPTPTPILTPEPMPPAPPVTPATTSEADLVLLNGKIITVDPQDTIAQAVAVRDGKIVKVGHNDNVKAFIGRQTNVLDLKGKTVTPGLVDSHIHIREYGRQFWEGYLDIRFPNAGSKADLLRLVADRAKVTPEGEWISGNRGFLLSMDETPDRWELDSVSPTNPVYLPHISGKYAAVNSYALKLAGIDKDTPNPYGGVIESHPTTKEPTGILLHYAAMNLVNKIATGYGARTDEELMDDVKRGQDLCLAAGYTSGQDVTVTGWPKYVLIHEGPRYLNAYERVAENAGLKMRIYLMHYIGSEIAAGAHLKIVEPFKTEMLTFGGWKLTVDGGIAAGTVAMYDSSLPIAERSLICHDQETLNRIVSIFHKAGFQIAFHAMGDKAIDMAVNAIEAALKETPRMNHRHRIEHLLFPTPQALERIKKLGIVVSLQPQWIHLRADGLRGLTDEKTMERFMPIRTMMEMGISIAFGCDVPGTSMLEPKWAFIGAVTRTTTSGYIPAPQECISIRDALRIHTIGSAYASFEEDIKGSIEEGKLADMVVWSHDLYSVPISELEDLKAEITIVGGKIVYEEK